MVTEYPDVTDWGRIAPERRGRWGRWLYAMRWRHDRTTQDAVRETLAKMGAPLSAPYYSDFEGGRATPNEEWQAAFRRLWDSEPAAELADAEPAPAADLAALLARLDEQARVIDRLAGAIEALARGQAAWVRGLTGAAAQLAQEPEADPASPSHAGTRP